MGGIRVKGLREYQRALRQTDKALDQALKLELRALAESVAVEVRHLSERFGQRTTSGIRPGSRLGVDVVRQGRRKTTRQHPEFGGVQMRLAFLPALESQREAIYRGVEKMLDRLIRRF